ncbi:hypothetical protein FACS1894202_13160 [Clostridia bacterium]|nr:hypothetical protein FACS1894202_13160 [Clostridia bacterium]
MEDFREVIYFGLSCIAAAFLIGMVAMFSHITGDMASVRHAEIQDAAKLEIARKYSELDSSILYGVEVVALMKENTLSREEVRITVDRNKNNAAMTQYVDNYSAFTTANLKTLIAADSRYAATVTDGEIRLVKQ